ncbi:cation/acetate symporter [Variovorax sp. OK212]|nr:cation/acetate symporter [Variovorax sp. OK212]
MGGAAGLVSAVALTTLGPSIWVKLLGNAVPVFPYDPPTIFSMPLAFAVCWIVSVLDRSAQSARDRANFDSSTASTAVATQT